MLGIISIHTPLAGSDQTAGLQARGQVAISIHTPLAGSDYAAVGWGPALADFNPHSPRGE